MPRSDADSELMDLQRAMSVQGTEVAGLPSGASVAADPNTIRDWEARKAAQREAYGQFVANGDIHIGNALAFTSGMSVPLEHVIMYDLEEREQVNRVADPAMARVGKVYDSDEAFLAANPHVARQAKTVARSGDAAADPLDPRGAAAAKDDARKAGKDAPTPTTPGEDTEERREAAAEAVADANQTDSDKGSSAKPRRSRANQEG